MFKDDTVALISRPPDAPALRRSLAVGPSQTAPMSPLPGHIPMLDGVRGLAILLVLIYHFTLDMSGQDLVTKAILKVTAAGWCGVDLFFVLSGFLITGILADTKGAPHRSTNFYARRALRIFPLYYASLVAVFASLPWIARSFGSVEGFAGTWVWLALYAANVLVAIRGSWFPLSHFWSLAVEEHFYLFWPAVVFRLERVSTMKVCIVVVVLAFILRTFLVARGAVLAAYCLTPCRIDALAIGGFLALAIRGPRGIPGMVAVLRWVGAAAAGGIVAIAAARRGLPFHDPTVQTAGYLCLDLVFASLILLPLSSDRRTLAKGLLESPPLLWLGRYSYGLYVFNSIFLLVAEGLALLPRLVVYTGSPAIGSLLYLAVGFSSTLLAAWLSWHLVEKPFLNLKRYFPSAPAVLPST